MTWVKLDDLGQGLNKDALAEELDITHFSDSLNVRFRDGFAERFKGMVAAYTTPPVIPYCITAMTVGTSRYVVYEGLQKTYVDDGTTQTNITNANNTGAVDDRFSASVFNGIYIKNNGVDVPQYWAGVPATPLANLTAWPAGYKAGFMRPYKNYLIAGDITKAGTRYRGLILTSHLADPGTIPTSWDSADPTKDVVEQPLDDTNGTLIDSLPLGDMNVIYKDDALHYMQTVQSRSIFRFGRLPGDTGLLARGCVVNVPGVGHVYLTPGFDVVYHNGQGPQPIIQGKMRTWLKNNINATYGNRSFLVLSPQKMEVLVCFPSNSSQVCDMALIWNYKDNTLYIRALSSVTYGCTGQITLTSGSDVWSGQTDTWATISRTWAYTDYAPNSPRVILSRSTPTLALFDATETDYGTSFNAYVERTGLHFDNPEMVKLIRRLRIRVDAAAGTQLSVSVGGAMVPGAAPAYSMPATFTAGTDVEVTIFALGRFLAWKVQTTGNTPWRIRSCEIDVMEQGGY